MMTQMGYQTLHRSENAANYASDDPRAGRVDMADVVRLLQAARDVDLDRVREYFRLFDREKELEALLAELEMK
jgi:hypothetical protein